MSLVIGVIIYCTGCDITVTSMLANTVELVILGLGGHLPQLGVEFQNKKGYFYQLKVLFG